MENEKMNPAGELTPEQIEFSKLVNALGCKCVELLLVVEKCKQSAEFQKFVANYFEPKLNKDEESR